MAQNGDNSDGKDEVEDEMNGLLDYDDDGSDGDSIDSALDMVGDPSHTISVDTETDYAMEIAEIDRLLKTAGTAEKKQTLLEEKDKILKKKDLQNLRLNTSSVGPGGGLGSGYTPRSSRGPGPLLSQGSGVGGRQPFPGGSPTGGGGGGGGGGGSPTHASGGGGGGGGGGGARKTKLFEAAPVQRPTSARPRSARTRSISLKAIPEDGIYNRRTFKRQNSSRRPSVGLGAGGGLDGPGGGVLSLPGGGGMGGGLGGGVLPGVGGPGGLLVGGGAGGLAVKIGVDPALHKVEETAAANYGGISSLAHAESDDTGTQPSSPVEGELCELPRSVFAAPGGGVWATSADPRHPPPDALGRDRRRFWLSTGGFPQALGARFCARRRLTIVKVIVSAVNVKQLQLQIEYERSKYIDAAPPTAGSKSPGRQGGSIVTLPPPHRQVGPNGEVRRRWEAFSHTFEVGGGGEGFGPGPGSGPLGGGEANGGGGGGGAAPGGVGGREALGFRLLVRSAYGDFAAITSLQVVGMVGSRDGSKRSSL